MSILGKGTVVNEVVGADLPPEPPVGTVIIDAKGTLYQLVSWTVMIAGVYPSSYVAWSSVGDRPKRGEHPNWPELLARGPITIVWRPDPKPPYGIELPDPETVDNI